MEQDVVIVHGDAIPEDIMPEVVTSDDVISEEAALEKDSPEDAAASPEDGAAEDDQKESVSEDVVLDELSELTSEDDAKRYTVHPAHTNYPTSHSVFPHRSHPALKMPVMLDAVISRRSCSVAEILSWKPGNVIEFDSIQPTITLESNGVALGQGKPIEQNLRIGIQLE